MGHGSGSKLACRSPQQVYWKPAGNIHARTLAGNIRSQLQFRSFAQYYFRWQLAGEKEQILGQISATENAKGCGKPLFLRRCRDEER